jgi:hypothetical protein
VRNGGVRRTSKPYPNAPDRSYPLADGKIEQLKPFYVQVLLGSDQVASFVSKVPQDPEDTAAIAAWFDYQLKQGSNFEREGIIAIDALLQNGACPMKVFKSKSGLLQFDGCDAMHIIVPKWTEEMHCADRLVHVMPMSVTQYKRNKSFKSDEDFIKRIKGKGQQTAGNNERDQLKDMREGITHGSHDEEIVVWEIYTRDPEDYNKVIIKTRSPMAFDEPIRPDFQMPYNQGVFKEGWFPFVQWRAEITTKGYYSPRGLSEILAPFQASICKTWNTIEEWKDFHSKPLYEQDPAYPVGNTGNIQTSPGSILPAGLKPVQAPATPTILREDMNMTRELAEARVAVPDYGVLEETGGHRTATATNAIVNMQGQGTNLRSVVHRLDIRDTLRIAWAIALQYGQESLSFVLQDEYKQLPEEALHENYEVTPNGNADSWNKDRVLQRAQNRFQLLRGDPYIKQGPLRKDLLSADEAGLVKTHYQEPQDAQASEREEQGMELLLMEAGRPAQVDPTDDDKAHIAEIVQYLDQKRKLADPVRPRMARLILMHGGDHQQQLLQKKDPEAKAIAQQLAPMLQVLGVIAKQPDPDEIRTAQVQQAGQSNVVPMQPGMPAAGSAAQGVSAPAPVAQDQQNDSAKQVPALMQGLASLKKAGVPITYDDINAVLERAGLPPLQASPAIPAVTPTPQQAPVMSQA